jgi:S-adenosylmethionine synthetase
MTSIITSESVFMGHPDKLCDRISDGLLDLYLSQDKFSRTAIEVMATQNRLIIAGEVSSQYQPSREEREHLVRKIIEKIGYDDQEFSWSTCLIDDYIHGQSQDIIGGLFQGSALGAGDQGTMFGYACNETEEGMPASLHYAHLLAKTIDHDRINGKLPYLKPDGKVQLSLIYEDNHPIGLKNGVISCQHEEHISMDDLRDIMMAYVHKVLPSSWKWREEDFYINPSGRFVKGGPPADTGLTGRKIIVDTYGGVAPHGGGAFSGKDPTKVDRSGAYMARYLAKNIVKGGFATRCCVQISYIIGHSEQGAFSIDTYGTGIYPDQYLAGKILNLLSLSPGNIIEHLCLRDQNYEKTSCYGHFGRKENLSFSWESEDFYPLLKSSIGL